MSHCLPLRNPGQVQDGLQDLGIDQLVAEEVADGVKLGVARLHS